MKFQTRVASIQDEACRRTEEIACLGRVILLVGLSVNRVVGFDREGAETDDQNANERPAAARHQSKQVLEGFATPT